MKPKNSPSASQQDLFRLQLSSMIDMRHELVLLAKSIDWQVLDTTLGASIVSTVGNSALPTRLVAGLLYLQHAFSVSDEVLCARWLENPYWQYFCGEVYFQHKFPCHPTSLTKWRNRL
ncbi:MAG: IS5/IS1182 family transposase, partial [Gammaproteobacteria bacterium]